MRNEESGRPAPFHTFEGSVARQACRTASGSCTAALRTRIQAFQKKEQDANTELQASQTSLQSIQSNVLRQIDARLGPAVNQVMVQRGANVAVDVSSTIAHSAATDVTPAVLAALNATLPSVTLTPLLATQQPAAARPAGR